MLTLGEHSIKSISHKQILVVIFASAGVHYGITAILDFDSALHSFRSFFDHAPDWQVRAGAAILTASQFGFIAVALVVFRDDRSWIAVVIATATILFTGGLIPIGLGGYLIWYHYAAPKAPNKYD